MANYMRAAGFEPELSIPASNAMMPTVLLSQSLDGLRPCDQLASDAIQVTDRDRIVGADGTYQGVPTLAVQAGAECNVAANQFGPDTDRFQRLLLGV